MDSLLLLTLVLLAGPFILKLVPAFIKYSLSDYKNESSNSFVKYYFNTGNYGEGLTFMELEKIPGHSRILANVYLPTEDGTTEVDLIFINQSGIYAVESKNYTGWIFGDYRKKVWTSVIYKSKHKFFNPIWQSN